MAGSCENEKKLKQLRKKLDDIKRLKDKAGTGHMLCAEEAKKVESEALFVKQIADLESTPPASVLDAAEGQTKAVVPVTPPVTMPTASASTVAQPLDIVPNTGDEDIQKRLKTIKKKLADIDKLKMKKEQLNAPEQTKIASKDSLEEEQEQLCNRLKSLSLAPVPTKSCAGAAAATPSSTTIGVSIAPELRTERRAKETTKAKAKVIADRVLEESVSSVPPCAADAETYVGFAPMASPWPENQLPAAPSSITPATPKCPPAPVGAPPGRAAEAPLPPAGAPSVPSATVSSPKASGSISAPASERVREPPRTAPTRPMDSVHLLDAITKGLRDERRKKYLPTRPREKQWEDNEKAWAYGQDSDEWKKQWWDSKFAGTVRFKPPRLTERSQRMENFAKICEFEYFIWDDVDTCFDYVKNKIIEALSKNQSTETFDTLMANKSKFCFKTKGGVKIDDTCDIRAEHTRLVATLKKELKWGQKVELLGFYSVIELDICVDDCLP